MKKTKTTTFCCIGCGEVLYPPCEWDMDDEYLFYCTKCHCECGESTYELRNYVWNWKKVSGVVGVKPRIQYEKNQ